MKQIQLDLAQSVRDDSASSDPVQEESPSSSDIEADLQSCETECPVCEVLFQEDVSNMTWVECTECSKWMHSDDIPSNHPSSPHDEEFTCIT